MECNITYVPTYVCMYLYIYIYTTVDFGKNHPRIEHLELQTNESNPYPWVFHSRVLHMPNTSAARRPRTLSQAWLFAKCWFLANHNRKIHQRKSGFHPEKCGLIILLGDLPAVCLSHKAHGFRIPTWLVWSPVHVGCLFTHDHIWVVRLGHRSTS